MKKWRNDMELIIGNKNYSSWSLRAWLMLRAFDLPFNEVRLALFEDDFYKRISDYSSAGKVPVLVDGDIKVWDSLAICEYINEALLDGKAWPTGIGQRAHARAIVSEMHSGFMALRRELPMNCRATRKVNITADAQKDIDHIDKMWSHLREEHNAIGPWLFGKLTIADIFYAPVALRFAGYQMALSAQSEEYINTILTYPPVQAWIEDSKLETEVIETEEVGQPI